MDMIGKIRRMKLRDKFSTSTIAKLTGLPGTLAILHSCNLAEKGQVWLFVRCRTGTWQRHTQLRMRSLNVVRMI